MDTTYANVTCADIASWPCFRVSVDMGKLPELFTLMGEWLAKDIEDVTFTVSYDRNAEFDNPVDLKAWAVEYLK